MSWKTELKNNITNVSQLAELLKKPPLNAENPINAGVEDFTDIEKLIEKFPMSIPSYYFSLIDFNNPLDPIRKMSIPSIEEALEGGSQDTSGENDNTILPGLQHKYRETALILSTNRCAMYCRHCFRKRLVGLSDNEIATQFNDMAHYISEHKEISNVLISGGDSFLLDNDRINHLLELLTPIEHLDLIRFGTRVPVVFPQRINQDPELIEILKKHQNKKQIYVITQFNHSRELTEQAKEAIRRLTSTGVIVKNQIVLLKDINDTAQVLSNLLKDLTSCGIVPYYIFQCRPVTGVKNHFQVPLAQGYKIVEQAKNMQNGQGKCLKYCMSHPDGKIEIIGQIDNNQLLFKFHEAKQQEDYGRIFMRKIDHNQCWLNNVN